ncbi:MAG: multiple sugar transport system ATP-binding protein [Solirubrobacteraceae bacterium]|jgi:multiple sugar transport system ATP-binding protein|nr:multiple sugar transport system ATP-binding protein [Solirubrobacteraceae bacterium]
MTSVRYDHATRTYDGTSDPAVDNLDLDIGDGELLVLVGPSGSGKSTALRMLAGLEPLDAGSIHIGDRDVSNVRPRDRDIAMVFQNYALYPQLTVAENMGFALKQQGVPKQERVTRVRETARVLDLEPYLDRKPKHLSGGQRQRVAMGRAIVRQPAVYLMDEPLSNLDAKLRVQTRTEVVELQARLGVTTVYVTHDQVEAMTMGHRVAVLKDGVLQQCDTPGTLYHEPINLFVAGFIGSPAMNLVEVGEERPLRLAGSTLALAPPGEAALADAAGAITVGFRPEALQVGDGPLAAQIRTVEDLGSEVFVHLALEHQGEPLALVSKMLPPFDGRPGDTIGLQITGATHLFAADGSRVVSTTGKLHGTSASASMTADASTSTP